MSRTSRGSERRRGHGRRVACESLELRRLLAIVTVSNTADVINGTTTSIAALIAAPGPDGISLREAITAVNATVPIVNEIHFNIPGAGPYTIVLTSALPTFTQPMIIDGTSEPDFAGSPIVQLNGNNLAINGLTIGSTAGGTTIRGLVINRCGLNGIVINGGGGNNTIAGNYIGTSVDGSTDLGNGVNGISVLGQNNQIGGMTAADRNVISGNNLEGVVLATGSTGTVVEGNYIGTNAAGTAALGNADAGIFVQGQNSRIGGTDSTSRNIISGNGQNGVTLFSGGSNTIVQGNYIGTNAAGTQAIANSAAGVNISSSLNTIGGTNPGAGNLISGNFEGLLLSSASAVNNTIQGNRFGTDVTGTLAMGNSIIGIDVSGAVGTLIGGTVPGAGNLISGSMTGLYDEGSGTLVQGNLIGTDASGTSAISNDEGVYLAGPNAVIGGSTVGARNVISGNRSHGVAIIGVGSGARIEGNYIGTDITGTVALPNLDGIALYGSPGSHIGGIAPGTGNVISGNTRAGISMEQDTRFADVLRNFIGTQADGASPLGNGSHGIRILLARDLNIGNSTPESGNTIAYNGGAGIGLFPSGLTDMRFLSNSIFSNGLLGIDLGLDGVTLNDAGDVDSGTNGLLNFPVIGSAVLAGGHTVITGSLNAPTVPANTGVLIQLFQSPTADSSGYGEGQTLLKTLDLATNASGNVSFSLDLPVTVAIGTFITATATWGTDAETSEFSQAVQVATQPMLTLVNASVVEGNSGIVNAVFTVLRTGNTSAASSLMFSVSDGTAISPGDYAPFFPTLLTFAPGETSKTITVPVKGDTVYEPDETFYLNVSSLVNANIDDAQAVGTIINDDADLSPPAVLTSAFNFVGFLPTPYEVQFQMNEPVVASPGGVPVLIRRIDNGQLVATIMASIQDGNVVFGQMTTPLADGNYRATLPSGAVVDLSGNPLASDVDTSFFILAGDANRDRVVDVNDLVVLANNWLGTGKTFGEGDFNYDGVVNPTDLGIMATHWQQRLDPPAPALPAAPTAARRSPTRTPVRVIELVA